ncbi:MAG TPA: SOS response-associated peptidase [Polyangiaceae bacterium]|nr:SOS response-associated peptidase [Polyangiaceae bacterium]
MCGRLVASDPAALVEGWSQTRLVPSPADLAALASYNVSPSQRVLVLRAGPRGREIAAVRWGLVPAWAKEPLGGRPLFNARSETAAEKPAFREALRLRRCVALADAFYEWKREGRRRVPYRVVTSGVMMLAGVWERWQGPSGEALESAAILTRAAGPALRALHDREPVMFATREQALGWIAPELRDAVAALELLREAGPSVELREANAKVGRAGEDGPECLVPGASPGTQLTLC